MTATKDELLEAFESLITGVKYTPKYYIQEIRSIIEQYYSLTEYERKAALKYVNDNLRVNGGG